MVQLEFGDRETETGTLGRLGGALAQGRNAVWGSNSSILRTLNILDVQWTHGVAFKLVAFKLVGYVPCRDSWG